MSDNKENLNAAPILINSQYIKDLSLEIPYAPEIFKEMTSQPELKIDVSIESKKIDEQHNVILNISINGDLKGKKVFVLELAYGALVTLNVPQEHI